MPIGHGTVAIGMSERTQGRMIEMVAKALFEKGAAERVLAVAIMTKDRAHMHLDTVFTLLDRDKATAFPKVVNNIRAVSLRPGAKPGDFHVTEEKDFVSAVADALKIKKLTVVETGGDEYQAAARAVGRRQQHRRARAGCRRLLRAEHVHHRQDAQGRRRGCGHRRLRARQGPRRRALHDLPDPARPAVEIGSSLTAGRQEGSMPEAISGTLPPAGVRDPGHARGGWECPTNCLGSRRCSLSINPFRLKP